jgi:hypothetical protein
MGKEYNMGLLDKIFGSSKRTMLDDFNQSVIGIFRGCGGGLQELSDKEILEISSEVMSAFKKTSEQKGEQIPGGYLFTIAMYLLVCYQKHGKSWYIEHLKYELDRYIEMGLREDYKRDLF